jgi:hypothetical protein
MVHTFVRRAGTRPAILSLVIALCGSCVATLSPENEEHVVIIDTDPAGHSWSGLDVDDDMALLALVAAASGCRSSSKFSIAGITTVAGNGPQRHTFADAAYITRRLNLSVPVVRGAAWWPPGLDSWRSQANRRSEASAFIVKTVLNSAPGTVTVLCLGPLTNMAAALDSEPLLVGRLRRIVIMGGDLEPLHLDLNMLSDRYAANRVLRADLEKRLVPVQTCTQVVFTHRHLKDVLSACSAYTHSSQDGIGKGAPVGCAPALLGKMRNQLYLMPKFINPRLHPVPSSIACSHNDLNTKSENTFARRMHLARQVLGFPQGDLQQGFVAWYDLYARMPRQHVRVPQGSPQLSIRYGFVWREGLNEGWMRTLSTCRPLIDSPLTIFKHAHPRGNPCARTLFKNMHVPGTL